MDYDRISTRLVKQDTSKDVSLNDLNETIHKEIDVINNDEKKTIETVNSQFLNPRFKEIKNENLVSHENLNFRPNTNIELLNITNSTNKTNEFGKYEIQELGDSANFSKSFLKRKHYNTLSINSKDIGIEVQNININNGNNENTIMSNKDDYIISIQNDTSKRFNSSFSNKTKKYKTIGNYLLTKVLGKGTFGKVFLGIDSNKGNQVAIKVLEKSKIEKQEDFNRLCREIRILESLDHENVIKLYHTINTKHHYSLVTEYIKGGDLYEYLCSQNSITEKDICLLFRQILSAVEFINSKGVAHRDIKPENILVEYDSRKIKLIDFGLSNIYEQGELLKTPCGSPCYAPPEMILSTDSKRYYGLMSDLWSTGVVLYFMLCGELPFEDEHISLLYKKITKGIYTVPNFLSKEAQDLIRKILVVDVSKRITIDQIKNHPWYLMEEFPKDYVFEHKESHINSYNFDYYSRMLTLGNVSVKNKKNETITNNGFRINNKLNLAMNSENKKLKINKSIDDKNNCNIFSRTKSKEIIKTQMKKLSISKMLKNFSHKKVQIKNKQLDSFINPLNLNITDINDNNKINDDVNIKKVKINKLGNLTFEKSTNKENINIDKTVKNSINTYINTNASLLKKNNDNDNKLLKSNFKNISDINKSFSKEKIISIMKEKISDLSKNKKVKSTIETRINTLTDMKYKLNTKKIKFENKNSNVSSNTHTNQLSKNSSFHSKKIKDNSTLQKAFSDINKTTINKVHFLRNKNRTIGEEDGKNSDDNDSFELNVKLNKTNESLALNSKKNDAKKIYNAKNSKSNTENNVSVFININVNKIVKSLRNNDKRNSNACKSKENKEKTISESNHKYHTFVNDEIIKKNNRDNSNNLSKIYQNEIKRIGSITPTIQGYSIKNYNSILNKDKWKKGNKDKEADFTQKHNFSEIFSSINNRLKSKESNNNKSNAKILKTNGKEFSLNVNSNPNKSIMNKINNNNLKNNKELYKDIPINLKTINSINLVKTINQNSEMLRKQNSKMNLFSKLNSSKLKNAKNSYFNIGSKEKGKKMNTKGTKENGINTNTILNINENSILTENNTINKPLSNNWINKISFDLSKSRNQKELGINSLNKIAINKTTFIKKENENFKRNNFTTLISTPLNSNLNNVSSIDSKVSKGKNNLKTSNFKISQFVSNKKNIVEDNKNCKPNLNNESNQNSLSISNCIKKQQNLDIKNQSKIGEGNRISDLKDMNNFEPEIGSEFELNNNKSQNKNINMKLSFEKSINSYGISNQVRNNSYIQNDKISIESSKQAKNNGVSNFNALKSINLDKLMHNMRNKKK